MTLAEHYQLLELADISPRVVCYDKYANGSNRPPSKWFYIAWTPTKEGPSRPDYQAAHADLREICAEYAAAQKYT